MRSWKRGRRLGSQRGSARDQMPSTVSQVPPRAQGPAGQLGPALAKQNQGFHSGHGGAASRSLTPGPAGVRCPLRQGLGDCMIPRVSKVRPEDSTFWLLLGLDPDSRPKKGAVAAPTQNPTQQLRTV